MLKTIWRGGGLFSKPLRIKKGTDSAFPLDRSIIVLLYKKESSENMNKLCS
jgi:hypothetical protein